jgi:hypothetical protein
MRLDSSIHVNSSTQYILTHICFLLRRYVQIRRKKERERDADTKHCPITKRCCTALHLSLSLSI